MQLNFFVICLILKFIFIVNTAESMLFAQDAEGLNRVKILKELNDDKWKLIGNHREYSPTENILPERELSEKLGDYEITNGLSNQLFNTEDSLKFNLSLFEFDSQVLAFGFYSVEKSPSLSFQQIGFESYLSGQMMSSWYGEYVLFVETPDTLEAYQKHLKKLSEGVIKSLPEQKKETPILDSFPEKDLVKHSKKFYLKNWLAQDYFKNIYYADYYTQKGYSRIFIIDNGYTATADSNFWKYHSFMKENAVLLPNELKLSTDYYVVDEPLWGKTILAKKNQIIYGILDYHEIEWTEDRLEELLERLKKKKVVKPG